MPSWEHDRRRGCGARRIALLLAAGYAAATALLLASAGRSPIVFALVIAAVIGCTEPIVVALTSLLPRFVPRERLSRAYGLEASSYNLAAIVAAGALGLCALPLLPFPPPPDRTDDPPTLGSVVTGGLVVLVRGRVLRALTVATTVAWLGFGGVAVTAVLVAEHLGAEPSAGGRLLVALAVGSLLGSLASSRLPTPRHAEPVMVAGLVGFGASLAAVAVAPSAPWALAAFVLAGLCEGPVFAATLMLRQREAPPDRLGQVNTTAGSLKIGASALGAALTAVLAGTLGADGLVLAIAGCQFVGAALGVLLLAVPREKSIDAPTAGP